MNEIRSDAQWGLEARSIKNQAVPEQFVILRSLQFAAQYWEVELGPLRSSRSEFLSGLETFETLTLKGPKRQLANGSA
jgi:hypothetical protein